MCIRDRLVYGDESMDQTQDRVCAVVGVIGTEEQWDWIEPIWKSITKGLSLIHIYLKSQDSKDK